MTQSKSGAFHRIVWLTDSSPKAVPFKNLFVCGTADDLIPLDKSRLLTQSFPEALREEYVHEQRHIVPSTAEFRNVLKARQSYTLHDCFGLCE